MEKNYKAIVALFSVLSLTSLAGFYKSYFQFFPDFKNITFFTHIHFVIFICWFLIIAWQPILVKQKKLNLHKKIGKLTYFLAPIMVISILLMVKFTFAKNLINSKESALMGSTGAILDATAFAICYIISMFNVQKTRWHVAFIIGASLIVFNPGLGRFIISISNQKIGILIMALMPILIPFAIIIYEKIKFNRAIFKNPYLLFVLIWIVELACFAILPKQLSWQNFIQKIANL
jgi:hypothetical protein